MEWLEVSLTVNGELAEAVAEVLARFSANGVMTEQGVRHLDEADPGTPDGPITVRAYLPVDEQLETKQSKIQESLRYLGMIQSVPSPTFRAIAEQNWMEAWKRHYRPIPIGRRLMVIPAWLEPPDATRIPIRIDPGMAFGTGTHPSTQLCLECIDRLLDSVQPGERQDMLLSQWTFIDVGCGSGILSIAALKLGAVAALAVDIDPDSIRSARENARVNGIGAELTLAIGSVREVLSGQFALRKATLVAVNILAPVIMQLLEEGLPELLVPGGSMTLAGILETQAQAVQAAAERAGLTLQEQRQMGDWVALRVTR